MRRMVRKTYLRPSRVSTSTVDRHHLSRILVSPDHTVMGVMELVRTGLYLVSLVRMLGLVHRVKVGVRVHPTAKGSRLCHIGKGHLLTIKVDLLMGSLCLDAQWMRQDSDLCRVAH